MQYNEDATQEDQWFTTGDVATIDRFGHFQITDRSKDVIKSGGEWISSIEVEGIIMSHPAVSLSSLKFLSKPAHHCATHNWDCKRLTVGDRFVNDQINSRDDELNRE